MAKSQETSENIAAGISCPRFFQNSLCSDNSSPSAETEITYISLVEEQEGESEIKRNLESDESGWTKSLAFLPNLSTEKIERKLVQGSAAGSNTAPLKAYKNKKQGYRLWREGFDRLDCVIHALYARSSSNKPRRKQTRTRKSSLSGVRTRLGPCLI